MKQIILVIFQMLSLCTYSQLRCGTDEYYEALYLKHPEYKVIHDSINHLITSKAQKLSSERGNRSIITIPVIVHVVGDNVIDVISANNYYKVHEQIKILNDDYRRNSGTLGYGNGVDTKIEFCLALTDPNGKPTNGITVNPGTFTQQWDKNAAAVSPNSDKSLKSIVHWNPYQYLNFYVVDLMDRDGYSTFPQGMSTNPELDGVVIAFDRLATGSYPTRDRGRSATHEIGHWLNLQHPWGNSCNVLAPTCGDDGVDDTPLCKCAFFSNYNGSSCTQRTECSTENQAIPITDQRQIENYMDYSDDICLNMFTQGQADRMNATITTVRTSLSNSASTGCNTSNPLPAHCFNLSKDGDESGIDCGGSCPSCVASEGHCYNGIQDPGETGIDCGGSCTPCSNSDHCTNGIKDPEESGVDCGGTCPPCSGGSVYDHCYNDVKDADEEGVDCGSSCYDPCHCHNGIQDIGETSIDCGGECNRLRTIDICSNDNPFPLQILYLVNANDDCLWWQNRPDFSCEPIFLNSGSSFTLKSKSIQITAYYAEAYSESNFTANDYIEIFPCNAPNNGVIEKFGNFKVQKGAFFEAKIEAVSCENPFSAYTQKCEGVFGNKSLEKIKNEELDVNNKINLFPNPAINNVTLTSQNEIVAQLNIFNYQGQSVLTKESAVIASSGLNIDINDFPNGYYIVILKSSQLKGGYKALSFVKNTL